MHISSWGEHNNLAQVYASTSPEAYELKTCCLLLQIKNINSSACLTSFSLSSNTPDCGEQKRRRFSTVLNDWSGWIIKKFIIGRESPNLSGRRNFFRNPSSHHKEAIVVNNFWYQSIIWHLTSISRSWRRCETRENIPRTKERREKTMRSILTWNGTNNQHFGPFFPKRCWWLCAHSSILYAWL